MFDDLRDLYQDIILEHGTKPLHMRRLDVFDATAKGDNPLCGDRVQVWVRSLDAERIEAVGFEARGCAISVASADLMVDAVQGRTRAEARALFTRLRGMLQSGVCAECASDDAMERLRPLAGVHDFPSRVKCATLPWHALTAALDGAKEASSE